MSHPDLDIRFATAPDGAQIAYWSIGSGTPIVIVQNLTLNHAELEWSVPSFAAFYAALAERYQVVRLNPAGLGLSGPPPEFIGDGADILGPMRIQRDLAAVVDQLDLDQFVLLAVSSMTPVAARYVTDNPNRVSHFIVCDGIPHYENSSLDALLQSYTALLDIAQASGHEVPVSMYQALAPPGELPAWDRLREASGLEAFDVPASIAAEIEQGGHTRLQDIDLPTLVISSRNQRLDFLSDARKVAASIPGATLRVVEGTFAPYATDHAATLSAIDQFLTGDTAPLRAPTGGFQTVVFTDVVGSTSYVGEVGDAAGRSAMRAVEDRVTAIAATHGGRVIKHMGDGSLITFSSNSSAIRFAIAVQGQHDGPLALRIGMAAGEPIEEDGDIHGAVVAQASRVADLAGPGEVMASDAVRQIALGKGFAFVERGQVTVKGFDEALTVWSITG